MCEPWQLLLLGTVPGTSTTNTTSSASAITSSYYSPPSCWLLSPATVQPRHSRGRLFTSSPGTRFVLKFSHTFFNRPPRQRVVLSRLGPLVSADYAFCKGRSSDNFARKGYPDHFERRVGSTILLGRIVQPFPLFADDAAASVCWFLRPQVLLATFYSGGPGRHFMEVNDKYDYQHFISPHTLSRVQVDYS